MKIAKTVSVLLLASMATYANAGISRNNYVDWVVVSAETENKGHFVQFKNSLQDNSRDCIPNRHSRPRVSFLKKDSNLLSLFLTAKASNKKVGFYYRTTTSIPATSGHGFGQCEFINAWLESD